MRPDSIRNLSTVRLRCAMQDDKELSNLAISDLLTSRDRYNAQNRVRATDLLEGSNHAAFITERTSFEQITS